MSVFIGRNDRAQGLNARPRRLHSGAEVTSTHVDTAVDPEEIVANLLKTPIKIDLFSIASVSPAIQAALLRRHEGARDTTRKEITFKILGGSTRKPTLFGWIADHTRCTSEAPSKHCKRSRPREPLSRIGKGARQRTPPTLMQGARPITPSSLTLSPGQLPFRTAMTSPNHSLTFLYLYLQIPYFLPTQDIVTKRAFCVIPTHPVLWTTTPTYEGRAFAREGARQHQDRPM